MLEDSTIYEIEDADEDWMESECKKWKSGIQVIVPAGAQVTSKGKVKMNGGKLKAEVVTEDENLQRHLQAPCSGKTIKVTVKTDEYPEETTWEVINNCQGFSVVMSGGPYDTEGETYVEEICAPEGEYTFSIMVSKTYSDSNPVCTCFSLSAAIFLGTNCMILSMPGLRG